MHAIRAIVPGVGAKLDTNCRQRYMSDTYQPHEARMATLQLTQVYLEREQKKALQARAKAHGTKVAEEVRRAVDAYLAGVTTEELGALDAGTQRAANHLAEMSADLDRVNARLDAAFSKLGGAERKGRRS
jgi:plasmid stability protein